MLGYQRRPRDASWGFELEQNHQRSLARLNQVDANLKRFDLLNQQYESDLKRLQSTVEAGNLFADHQEGPCPMCGADPQHHQQHGITAEQLDTWPFAPRQHPTFPN